MTKIIESKITIDVLLDENRVPEKLQWSAPDGGIDQQPTKAVFLSVWDPSHQEALRIDLWTKDMPVDEMKVFFYQTLASMANTYERATADETLSQSMRDFCEYFKTKSEEQA